jgi:hypothetical protein
VELSEGARFGVNIGVLLAAVVYSRWAGLRRGLRLPFRVFGWFFNALDRLFALVLFPFNWLIRRVARRMTRNSEPIPLPAEKEPDQE